MRESPTKSGVLKVGVVHCRTLRRGLGEVVAALSALSHMGRLVLRAVWGRSAPVLIRRTGWRALLRHSSGRALSRHIMIRRPGGGSRRGTGLRLSALGRRVSRLSLGGAACAGAAAAPGQAGRDSRCHQETEKGRKTLHQITSKNSSRMILSLCPVSGPGRPVVQPRKHRPKYRRGQHGSHRQGRRHPKGVQQLSQEPVCISRHAVAHGVIDTSPRNQGEKCYQQIAGHRAGAAGP